MNCMVSYMAIPAVIDAAGAVDVELDVFVGILGLQKQHLGDHEVGNLVVDGRAQQDDAVFEQTGEDIVGALAAVRLLDDHRDKLHA